MFLSSFNPFSIRNLRTRSASGPEKCSFDQFTATLVRNGRPVATIASLLEPELDDGLNATREPEHHLSLTFESGAEAEYFQKTVAEINPDSSVGQAIRTHELDDLDPAEAFIYLLAYASYLETRLAANCERFTLFRMPDDDDNAWKVVKSPYRTALAKKIRREHPGAMIANELLSAAA